MVFGILSVVLAIIPLSCWSAQLLSGFFAMMYSWAFWLLFSISVLCTLPGVVFGILSNDKLGYCLNTAAIVVTIILFVNWISLH
jgi:hypothetical protein